MVVLLAYSLDPQDFLVAQTAKRLPIMRETWVQSLGLEDHLEKGMTTHFSILTWTIHGQRRLAVCKESNMTERLTHT